MPRRDEMLPTTVPWKLLRHFDFHQHDRLEQHRLHLRERLAEAVLGADHERHVRAVDFVVLTVVQLDLDADHREAGDRALGQHVAEALFDGRDEVLRNATADDLVDEQQLAFGLGDFFVRHRAHLADDVGVLTGAAGLLLVLEVVRDRLRGRLRGS